MTKRQIIPTPKELCKYEKLFNCVRSGITRFYNEKNNNYKTLYYNCDCYVLRSIINNVSQTQYFNNLRFSIKQYNKIKL